MEKRIVVTIYDGLYYCLELEEIHNGDWTKTSATHICHENQLSDKIGDIMRGPSIFAR